MSSAAAPARTVPRMFAALRWQAAEVRALQELQAVLRGAPDAERWRWTEPDDLHLTLRFYGDARPEQAEAAGASLQRLAEGGATAPVEFEHLDAWPGVVVARFAAPAALRALQAELEREAQAQGFAAETRPWSPHVTLARTAREAGVELPRIKLAPFTLPVARLALCCHAPPAAAARRYATLASFETR